MKQLCTGVAALLAAGFCSLAPAGAQSTTPGATMLVPGIYTTPSISARCQRYTRARVGQGGHSDSERQSVFLACVQRLYNRRAGAANVAPPSAAASPWMQTSPVAGSWTPTAPPVASPWLQTAPVAGAWARTAPVADPWLQSAPAALPSPNGGLNGNPTRVVRQLLNSSALLRSATSRFSGAQALRGRYQLCEGFRCPSHPCRTGVPAYCLHAIAAPHPARQTPALDVSLQSSPP